MNNLFKIGLKVSPEEVFEVIGHGECTPNKKPSPEIYFWVLDKMKLPPDACLAIEDAPKGVDSAIEAGLKVIVTPSKYTSDEDFKKGKTKYPNDPLQAPLEITTIWAFRHFYPCDGG